MFHEVRQQTQLSELFNPSNDDNNNVIVAQIHLWVREFPSTYILRVCNVILEILTFSYTPT